MANGRYNVTVLAVHSTNQYSMIAKQEQFRTLRRGHRTSHISEIKVDHFKVDPLRKDRLMATVSWKPTNGM